MIMWMTFPPWMVENRNLRIEKIEPDASVFNNKEGTKQMVKNYNKEKKGQYNWMVLSLK